MMPPLPLLDGDTFFIDNARLESYMTCARKGEYTILRRRLPAGDEKSALSFGGALHAALELRYRHVGSLAPTPETEARQMLLLEKWWQQRPTPMGDHRTLGMAMKTIREYNREYPEEPFDLLELEGRHVVEEPFALPLGMLMVQNPKTSLHEQIKIGWTGRIDLPIRENDGIFVMDHKSSSMGGDYMMTEFAMSPALMGYCWALRERYNIKVDGAVINALVVRKPGKTERAKSNISFMRQKFFFDNDRLDEWRANTLLILRDFFRHWSDDYFPLHNTGKACVHKYGKCEYFNVCTLNPAARLAYLESGDFVDDLWSPLHAKSTDIEEVLALPADQLVYNALTPTPAENIDISELINATL